MNKYLYPIYKLKTKSYIKWWVYNTVIKKKQYELSEILIDTEFYLTDSVNKKFNLFIPIGRTTQDGDPTPENPIDIKNTGDNVNELNEATIQSGYVSGSGTIRYDANQEEGYSDFINVLPNTTYTFKMFESSWNKFGTENWMGIGEYSSNNTSSFIKRDVMSTGTQNYITFTTSSTTNYVIVSARGLNATTKKAKFEQGSVATPYSPYGCGNVNEKVQNKNLFDENKILLPDGAYTKTDDEIRISNGVRDFYAINFKENTSYTISYDIKNSGNGNGRLQFYYTDGTTEDCGSNPADSYIYTTRTSNSGKTLQKIRTTYGSGGNFYLKNIQIEQGSTDSNYIAHAEQNISFPLAQGQKLMEGDYLADDGVHHVMGEYVFTGEEELTLRYSYSDGSYCYSGNFIKDYKLSANLRAICTHFKYGGTVDGVDKIVNKDLGIYFYYKADSTSTSIYCKTKISSVTELKELLANMTITYELAEEVIDPYTEEQQTAWEEIKKARTYKNITHISSEDETPANLKIQYYKEVTNE